MLMTDKDGCIRCKKLDRAILRLEGVYISGGDLREAVAHLLEEAGVDARRASDAILAELREMTPDDE